MKLTIGQTIRGALMVKKLDKRRATNGNDYLTGELYDREGVYKATIWHDQTVAAEPVPGDVIEAEWKVGEYNGKPQLDVKRLYARIEKELVTDASAFIRQSETTREVWLTFYNAEVRPLIEDKAIERIIDRVLAETPFFQAPAAKTMHQNWRGGLAEHTHRMLQLFVSMAKSGHPSLAACRKSLVIAGIVLHDYGKAYEYEEIAPGQYEIGEWGSLLGHLAGGPIYLAQLIAGDAELEVGPSKLYMHLMHVLLAHHGQVDWGSPVVPATPEAMIVHYIDNLDGKLSMWEESEIGKKSYGLGTRAQKYEPEGEP